MTETEKIPKGIISRAETEELRKKLKILLSNKKGVLNELDKRGAKRMFDLDRRFTRCEQRDIDNLYGDYLSRQQKVETKLATRP